MTSSSDDVVESAAQALSRLAELDELLGNSHGDDSNSNGDSDTSSEGDDAAAWLTYLRRDHDLAGAVARHEATLRQLCDAYVDAHVAHADELARLYAGYTACEQHLVDFDTSIVAFQRRLEDSAEHMVKMQQQTDELVRRVEHRRLVSGKLSKVYSALQECDRFCDAVAAHGDDVDAHYLHNLRELDRKLAFLLHNAALQHSAVDTETRPKLTLAARKASDKLQRYLARTMSELATHEDMADVEAAQRALEESVQFAYHFLHVYNVPVAQAVTRLYVRTMSEAHVRWFTRVLRELTTTTTTRQTTTHALVPLVTAQELHMLACNRDTGAPSSSSTSMVAATATASRGAAEFDDTLRAVTALHVRHGRLHLAATAHALLDGRGNWAWRVVCCLQPLVNRTVAECRFLGNFFCVAGDREGGADDDRVEHLARATVGRALDYVHDTVLHAVTAAVGMPQQQQQQQQQQHQQHTHTQPQQQPPCASRGEVLAALRAVDVAKHYLCTSLDPIPLLLLSGLLETMKTTLRQALRAAVQRDTLALDKLATLSLPSFCRHRAGSGGGNSSSRGSSTRSDDAASGDSAAQLAQSGAYAATLAPHALVCRVNDALAELCLLNVTGEATTVAAATCVRVAADNVDHHASPSQTRRDDDDNKSTSEHNHSSSYHDSSGGDGRGSRHVHDEHDHTADADTASAADDAVTTLPLPLPLPATTTAIAATTTTAAAADAVQRRRLPAYEPLVTSLVCHGVRRLCDVVDALAARHEDAVARRLFACATLFAMQQRWRALCARFMDVVVVGSSSNGSGAASAVAVLASAELSSSPSSPDAMVAALAEASAGSAATTTTMMRGGGAGCAIDDACPVDVAAAQLRQLDACVTSAMDAYAHASLAHYATWRQLLQLAHDSDATTAAAIDDARVADVVHGVHASWSEALRGLVHDTRALVLASLGSETALQTLSHTLPHCTRATLTTWCQALTDALLRAQLQLVTSANATLASLVARMPSTHTSTAIATTTTTTAMDGSSAPSPHPLHASLVSNATLLHEVQQLLRTT